MNGKITVFLNSLITYDYILFGSVFALFILFFILGLLLRKKMLVSVLMMFLSFSILFFGSTIGRIKMHEYLFSNDVKIISQKKLTFTQAVVLYGELTNNSKVNFSQCIIKAQAYKVTANELKNHILKFKPFKKMSILEYDILKDEKREFKMIIEPFTYEKDYNISIGASCR